MKVGMKKNTTILFLLMILSLASSYLMANIDLYEFSNEANQERYKKLTKELRCPKCQNQDIADSNAPIATDMRREVHRLLEAGETDQTIVGFMVDRFGEFVSYKPKVKPETYMLWYGPWVLLFMGVVMIIFMASRRASSNKSKAKPDQDNHKQVEQLLSRFADEGSDTEPDSSDSGSSGSGSSDNHSPKL